MAVGVTAQAVLPLPGLAWTLVLSGANVVQAVRLIQSCQVVDIVEHLVDGTWRASGYGFGGSGPCAGCGGGGGGGHPW